MITACYKRQGKIIETEYGQVSSEYHYDTRVHDILGQVRGIDIETHPCTSDVVWKLGPDPTGIDDVGNLIILKK